MPQLPVDKANHALYGALLSLALYALLLPHTHFAHHFALAGAVLLGLAKEAADQIANLAAERAGRPPPHGVELLDALATAAGGFFLFVTVQLGA
jgi:hypothetical protein